MWLEGWGARAFAPVWQSFHHSPVCGRLSSPMRQNGSFCPVSRSRAPARGLDQPSLGQGHAGCSANLPLSAAGGSGFPRRSGVHGANQVRRLAALAWSPRRAHRLSSGMDVKGQAPGNETSCAGCRRGRYNAARVSHTGSIDFAPTRCGRKETHNP